MPTLLDQLYLCRANLTTARRDRDAADQRITLLEEQMDALLAQYAGTLEPKGK